MQCIIGGRGEEKKQSATVVMLIEAIESVYITGVSMQRFWQAQWKEMCQHLSVAHCTMITDH
jgi:hypothetical protein